MAQTSALGTHDGLDRLSDTIARGTQTDTRRPSSSRQKDKYVSTICHKEQVISMREKI